MSKLIIKYWNHEILEPETMTNPVCFDNEITQNVFDDQEDPFLRAIRQLNAQNHTYRRIRQLLTNRSIEDLTATELTIALNSLGLVSEGTHEELIRILKTNISIDHS